MKRIKYFKLRFCHNHVLTKPNICAKFQRNGDLSCITSCLVLPGFLMDTLLILIGQFQSNKLSLFYFLKAQSQVGMSNAGPKRYNDRQRIVFSDRDKIGVISYRKLARIVSDWAIDLWIYYAVIPNVIIKIDLRKYPQELTLCDYNIQNNNLENPGIDPSTSRMRSGRSTI